MTYKFQSVGKGVRWADAPGLYYKRFNGYVVNVPGSGVTPSPNPASLTASAFSGEDGINTAVNLNITQSETVYVWRGYFKPDQDSDSWQFRTRSNDGSFLWIDDDAENANFNLVTNDAIVKNGGQHTEQTVTSANITLSSSFFYAITLVAGNKPGNGSIRLEFRRDNEDFSDDGSGFFFHDARYSDGFGVYEGG